MKIGLKSKIFLFTAGLFSVVLILLLGIQTFVLGTYFENRQLKLIETTIEEMVFRTIESPEPDKEIYRLASENSLMHNVPFVVIDPEKKFFQQLNTPPNNMLVQTESGEVYSLIVDGFEQDIIRQFEVGNWIEFSGFQVDEQNLRAFFIETENAHADLESTFRNNQVPQNEIEDMMNEFSDNPVISQHGEIIFNNAKNIDAQGSNKLVGYHGEQIERFLMEHGIEAFFESDMIRVFDFEDSWTSTHNRLVVRPVFLLNDKQFLLISIISTVNTESTVSIIQEFYWVNFVVALLISFLATYIFAGRFSKPIINMESIAKQMAEMNFEQKVAIQSKDEIGSLAESLNRLSETLQSHIHALETSNSKLTDEIEFKTEQEEIRKAFVANVSHELKTPLTIMKGLIEGIKDGVYNDPSHLTSTLDEINRMEHMVYDMLEISKYEAKGIDLDIGVFSLEESVRRILNRLKPLSTKKGIHMDLQMDDGFVKADQIKIEQVLENLLTNAFRYAHEDGHVQVRFSNELNRTKCTITNDGSPIPEDALESIWQPFYRVESSRNRKKGGTGLGLVIVKSILDKHNAHYGAYNIDHGVAFYFELETVE